jgi:hypothetical protein
VNIAGRAGHRLLLGYGRVSPAEGIRDPGPAEWIRRDHCGPCGEQAPDFAVAAKQLASRDIATVAVCAGRVERPPKRWPRCWRDVAGS